MRTLAISIILISMISCLKAAISEEDSMPTVEVDDKVAAISKQLARRERPDLAVIKDIIAGKLPGWEKPTSNSMTLLQIMSYYKYPYEELKPLIKAWVGQGGNTQAQDAHGSTALHLAVRTINTPIVKLLLDLHVKDTITDSDEKLAIHHACERCEKKNDEGNNMRDIIESLLQPYQARLVGWTESSRTESQAGTEHSSNDLVKIDISEYKKCLLDYINRLDRKGNSPLYYASKSMLHCLKALDKADADIQKYKPRYGQAEQCYLYLKKWYANANEQKIKDNKLAIFRLGRKLEDKLGENLVTSEVAKPENYTRNFMNEVTKPGVANKALEEIKEITRLTKADTPINEGGPTILYWLIANGHREVARMLVEESEAAALGKSLAGDTSSACPLYAAVSQGDFELSKLLIYGKAIKKYRGQLAAQVAADSVEGEIVEERGGVITRSYADNAKTLLDAACASGNLAVVKLILESMAICTEKYENEQKSLLLENEIMDEFKYLPSDTHGYAEAIREFIEQVRGVIEGTRKSLDKKAQRTTGRSGGGGLSCFGFGGSVQGGKNMTAPPWDTSREHIVREARQGWKDKRNRIWE